MADAKPKSEAHSRWPEIIIAFAAVGGLIYYILDYLDSRKATPATAVIIAQSPRLNSDLDRLTFSSLRLSPHVVQTPFLLAQELGYDEAAGRGYLFALLINYGPAIMRTVRTSPFLCIPREGVDPRTDLDAFGDLGPIQDDTAYAILLDVIEPNQPDRPWISANFGQVPTHCLYITFEATFRDQLGRTQSLPFAVGEAPVGVTLIPTAGAPYISPE
jgi:hypothetical protein